MRSLLLLLALALASMAHAQPILVGDVNSYKDFPSHLEPYRKGYTLAQEQINAIGGVNRRKLAVLARDDRNSPAEAVRLAARLVERDKVHALMGGFAGNVGAALGEHAARARILYVATGPFTDDVPVNRYAFRLRPSAKAQIAMLMPDIARMKKRYWAILYPANAHGYDTVRTFKALLKKAQPDAFVLAEQAVPLGKSDGPGIVYQMFAEYPEAIFSTLFGTDLRDFVAEGKNAKLFQHVQMVNLQAGQPEDLALMKEAPEGWWVTGYPYKLIDYEPHRRFVEAYRKRWGEPPAAASLVGYTALLSIAQAARRAGGTRPEKLVEGLEDLETLTPLGVVEWRKSDRQSTFGAFVGQLGRQGQEVGMARWRYEPAASR